MIFLKMAFMNMIKHPKRSFLIMVVVAVSVLAMVLVGGLLDGTRQRFFDSMFEEAGHVQVHAAGYKARLDPQSLDYVIDDPDAVLAAFRADPDVVRAEKILSFGTKMIHGDKNLLIFGYGVDPQGGFFQKARRGVKEGAFLPGGRGIAISRQIAGLLHCARGDTVSLLVAWADGTPYYLSFPVTGIFVTDSHDFDANYFFISHGNAESLLALEGQTIELRVVLKDPQDADAFLARQAAFLKSRGLEGETWRQIFGSFVTLLQFFDLFMVFINLFVLVVAATVITNTILMSVFERVRDFGTLRAVGLKRRHVFSMIMLEGGLEGVLGGAVGLVLSLPMGLLLQSSGISGGEFVESLHLGSTYPFLLSGKTLVFAFVFGALVAVAGSFYAAFTNTRLKLVETLRYN